MTVENRKAEKTYIFHRGDMWYPIELYDDADAIANAEHNKGTTLVTDLEQKVIWKAGD